MSAIIPWARPHLFGDELEWIGKALGTSWISGGPFVEQLEADVGDFVGAKFTCATSNGTTALHLAYLALGVGAGSEVIIPGFAYLGAANVAILCGAQPVFAEVDSETWSLTAEAVERVISPRTKAIVAIQTYGNMCDMDALNKLASSHQIPLIEDAAEAFGSCYKGRGAGACGTIGTYSFHATKTITTGEGGMVVTDDPELHRLMQLYRSHGMARDVRYYWHQLAGHNFRLTNFQAAMGCAQFGHFPEIKQVRSLLQQQYQARLHSQDGIRLQRFAEDVDPVLWAMGVALDPRMFSQGRDTVLLQMKDRGIECRPGFYAASQQPLYHAPALPVCEDLARHVVSPPCYVGLKEEEVDHICRTLLSLRTSSS